MLQRTIFFRQTLNFSFDYLTLYDGDSDSAPIIGEYCVDSIPNNQISSNNSVLINFVSNGDATESGSRTYSGFYLEYQDPFPGKQRIIPKFACWNLKLFDY